MSSPQSQVVVVADQKVVSASEFKSSSSSRGGSDRGIERLIPTQGITVFFCIVLALLLKAQEFEEIMESLRISFDVVKPLLLPVILAVCGYLLLGVT